MTLKQENQKLKEENYQLREKVDSFESKEEMKPKFFDSYFAGLITGAIIMGILVLILKFANIINLI
jgi:tetrahydromethanopterin S-methyltransferase subunit B